MKTIFSTIYIKLWLNLLRVEYDCCVIFCNSICIRCDLSLFSFDLYFCKELWFTKSEAVLICGVLYCQRKWVFLRDSRSLLWCVCVVVICGWLHSGISSGFWGLDVALGVRVNQYKFVCVIFSFPNLNYICFMLFL